MKNKKQNKRGFTLIEIMLVVGIITVLLGGAIYYMSGNIETAREERVRADLVAITTQLKTYEMQNLRLPTSEQGLEALVSEPQTDPLPRRWRQLMKEVPLDPWGEPYQYAEPGEYNPDSFDLYSKGPDRVESEDDIGNWTK